MAINLKQINISDSDNIKLDKVNYNFDQLVANGGGPQGPIGPKGDTGFQGVMGPRGFQGVTGPQGPTGADAEEIESFWTRVIGNINSLTTDTLFPKPTPSSLNPPVISIGFLSTDPEYGVHQDISNGQPPYQWLINRKNHFYSNLRFKSSNVQNNWFDFIINYDQISNRTTFRMTFAEAGLDNPTRIIWSAENHIFKSNINGSNIISIGSNLVQFNRESQFNSRVKINQELYIENAGAGLNKIATSLDNAGQVVFKSIQELGGTVPYGTIISILPGVFADSSRFLNSEVINLNQSPYTINDPIKIRVGSGIGDYEGWYICNGKTWIDDTTEEQYIVPDLNTFSYSIDDNLESIDPNSQGSRIVINNVINLIGGADTSMDAEYNSGGVYNISSSIQSSDVDINTTSGTTYKIKRLPQIIYLGKSNLYWKDKGVDQAPSGTNTYIVDDLNNTSTGSPNAQVTTPTYEQGTSYTINITVFAATGYYFSSTPNINDFIVASGYSVGGVTLGTGTYPTYLTLSVLVSSHGAPNDSRQITWNSTSFITVTPLYNFTIEFVDTNSNGGSPTAALVKTGTFGQVGSIMNPGSPVIIEATQPGGTPYVWSSITGMTGSVATVSGYPSAAGILQVAWPGTIDSSNANLLNVYCAITSFPANGTDYGFGPNVIRVNYSSFTHKSVATYSLYIDRNTSLTNCAVSSPADPTTITGTVNQPITFNVRVAATYGYKLSSGSITMGTVTGGTMVINSVTVRGIAQGLAYDGAELDLSITATPTTYPSAGGLENMTYTLNGSAVYFPPFQATPYPMAITNGISPGSYDVGSGGYNGQLVINYGTHTFKTFAQVHSGTNNGTTVEVENASIDGIALAGVYTQSTTKINGMGNGVTLSVPGTYSFTVTVTATGSGSGTYSGGIESVF